MSNKKIDSKQAHSNEKTAPESLNSRRKLLRNTLIGGAVVGTSAVPDKWSKPVLDSVLLPAHAATTTDDSGRLPGDNPTTTPAPTTTQTTTTPAPTTTPFPTTTSGKKFTNTGIRFGRLDYDVT